MPAMKEEDYEGKGRVKIHFRSWRPDGKPRAIVVICHGVNSHGGQYIWAGEQFAARGLAAYALDLRGRGKSEGKRLWIDNVSDYVADVAGVIKIAKARDPGLPVFLLGHSAGGVISTTYTLDNQPELAGLICESFAFRVYAPGFVLSIIRWLGKVLPNLPVLKLKNKDFSRDPKAVAALEADPLIKNEIQPAKTVAELLIATDRMDREFSTITIPVFIMHGTADKATMPAGSQRFFDTVGSKDKTLKLYKDHYHDLLNDVGKEGVIAEMQAWIDKRIPA